MACEYGDHGWESGNCRSTNGGPRPTDGDRPTTTGRLLAANDGAGIEGA